MSKFKWFKFRKLKIRTAISWFFCTLLIVSTLITTTYTYINVTDIMDVTARDLISKNQEAIVNETMAYLEPARQITQMGSLIFKSAELDILNSPTLLSFLIGGLQVYPQASSFYAADRQGNYMALNDHNDTHPYAYKSQQLLFDDVAFTVNIVDRRSNDLKNFFRFLNHQGIVVAEQLNPNEGDKTFDPRQRTWFKRTAQMNRFNWSEVYVDWYSTDLMITASCPILTSDNTLQAIIAIDVPLKRINKLLAQQKVSHSGLNFIIDDQGQVISFPEPDKNLIYDGKLPRIKHLNEMNMPVLWQAYQINQNTNNNHFEFNYDDTNYYAYFVNFSDCFASPWTLVMVAPVDDFIGAIKQTNRNALLIALLIMGITTLMLIVFSHKISSPIEYLADQMHRIKNLDMDGDQLPGSPLLEIARMEQALSSMKSGLGAFSKFVPKELARSLITGRLMAELGGERRSIVIMFCDIANFTTISETMASDKLMLHLSDYLNHLSRIIIENKGTIDKYIGDAIMAFWGAPVADDTRLYNACHAVLLCHRRLIDLNQQWQEQGTVPLPTRFGLHYGEAIVGNVGSADRLNYTAIGDNVNISSRLESINKYYGTSILVSETVYNKMQHQFLMRPIDIVVVKGKAKSLRIYELLAELSDDIELMPDPGQVKCAELTHRAFDLFTNRKWSQAKRFYQLLLDHKPGDQVAILYIERCLRYQKSPPNKDWDGTSHLIDK